MESLLKHGLIVSCQALEGEPLHSSFIMSKMALAAVQGGAIGIRANSIEDIREIKKEVDVPIIGIIKANYPNSMVYITPTLHEVSELVREGVEVIAIDATSRIRPDGKRIDEFFKEIKSLFPRQRYMADCSTYEEIIHATELGFDYVGTTLFGYTDQSKGSNVSDHDFKIVKKLLLKCPAPLIVEGKIDTPEKYKRLRHLGVQYVVVGSAITRPQLITAKYTSQTE